MLNGILISHAALFHNRLCIVQHESAHDHESQVQANVVDELRAQEHVADADQEHGAHDGEQGAAKEQILPASCKHRRDRQGHEHNGGSNECRYNQLRINLCGEFQEETHAVAGSGSDTQKHREALVEVLSIVRGESEGQN